MPKTLAITLIALSIIATGCGSHDEPPSGDVPVPSQFTFIFTSKPAATLQQLIDKVGKYSRVRGKKAPYYEYDLPGGSAVLVGTEPPFTSTSMIRSVECYSSTNALKSFP